ncbi:Glycosyl hydrolases family 2, sugar binding domain [Planctomycetes bacterium CA13]|uniref:Glycosyl hydrolases family 2, sugar binding domain n=1 Tax=Novipirellula herctigrandis TaxID=2527986 RepID=A0A5C5YYU8_9BACT|nr:Glycosyl hydrolases family 2, sugar binding domain [Planctomycetes bacterium CA13]
MPPLCTRLRSVCFLTVSLIAATLPNLVIAQDRSVLHSLFTDHMVLQRDAQTPIWGWVEPNQTVTVSIAEKTAKATADAEGHWSTKIEPLSAGGPHTLKVVASGNGESSSQSISDVLVGDVWICSGQSNMEWPLAASNHAEAEIAKANIPELRLFTVPKRIAGQPVETTKSTWKVCTPSNVPRFSAVGYFFGRDLHQQLNVPIGLIHTSWGGTVAEAWTSEEGLRKMHDFDASLESLKQSVALGNLSDKKHREAIQKWWQENDPGSAANWQNANTETDQWKTAQLPAEFEQYGVSRFDGVVWFQKAVELPKSINGETASISLGSIDDQDTTWINGQWVGENDQWNVDRNYKIPAGILKEGRNVITIRVLDTGGEGGFFGQPEAMSLAIDGNERVSLAGDWKIHQGPAVSQMKPIPQRLHQNPNVVTVLYNGMIAPLVPYAIKGAIWYQGESNAGRAAQYRELLPTMIGDWRNRFEVGKFPFLIVQLANFMAVQQQPVEPGWADLREAQSMTAKNDDKVGLAVAIDIGEANDIHPRNKQDVGHRLMLAALGIGYDQKIVYSGPEFDSVEYRDGQALVKFKHVGAGLVAKGDKLKGFAIAGDDKTFVWADAAVSGDTVIVSSPGVTKPTAVRYNWANNPIGNFYNAEGLPAIPFRTDVE